MMEKSLSDIKKRCEHLKENYKIVMENVCNAAIKSGRSPEDIKLLAATKTVPVEVINYGIDLGIKYIGENRVQELMSKIDNINLDFCNIHFIGHLQRNKVKQITGKVGMIESVDSVDLAKEISKRAVERGVKVDILIEVNVGREENKSGIYIENLYNLTKEIAKLDNIKIKGLMAIPPKCRNKLELDEYFFKMKKLFVDIRDKNIDNISIDTLSMGMSNDYVNAILNGATEVRVGSALFGIR